MTSINYDILTQDRKHILPLFNNWKDVFYLAGGTALALQLGHRDSIDFDFFTEDEFQVNKIIIKIENIFKDYPFSITQIEKNTLSIIIDKEIKVSFMTYPYPLIKPLIRTDHMDLASIPDIACMKLTAIMQRSALKDYIDLYEIMKSYSLKDLLEFIKIKYNNIDCAVILKSLSYLDDISDEPINYAKNYKIPVLYDLKLFFQNKVSKYLESITHK